MPNSGQGNVQQAPEKQQSDILKKLFSGNIWLDERLFSGEPDYRLLNQKIAEILFAWRQALAANDCHRLEKLINKGPSESLEVAAAFIQGFKLATHITLDMMTGQDDNSLDNLK